MVHERYILTAAHCLYSDKGVFDSAFKKGKRLKVKSFYLGKTRRLRVKKVYTHQSYLEALKKHGSRSSATLYAKDVAVVEVTPFEGVPSANLVFKEIPAGVELTLTGSGCTAKRRGGLFKFGNAPTITLNVNSKGNPILKTKSDTTKLCPGDSGGATFEGQDVVAINTAYAKMGKGQVNYHLNLADIESWLRARIPNL
jgi:hypothetical protein